MGDTQELCLLCPALGCAHKSLFLNPQSQPSSGGAVLLHHRSLQAPAYTTCLFLGPKQRGAELGELYYLKALYF